MPRHLAAALAALVLTGCGGDESGSDAEDETTSSPEAATLEDVYQVCANDLDLELDDFDDSAPPLEELYALEDDDTTIVVSPPESEAFEPLHYTAAECTLVGLEAPRSVTDDVLSTEPAAGPQTDSWDDVTLEWSDSQGLSATFTLDR